MLLEIATPYGNRYLVHPNGDIQRTDQSHTPSGEWKLQGIIPVRRRSLRGMIPLAQITPELLKDMPLTYGNGKPIYTGVDRDHGTTRVWGNTRYHGIRSMRFVHEQKQIFIVRPTAGNPDDRLHIVCAGPEGKPDDLYMEDRYTELSRFGYLQQAAGYAAVEAAKRGINSISFV
jgi:hypothetical protein